jgi:hypothetical protein
MPDTSLNGDATNTTDLRRLMVCTLRFDLALIFASLRLSLVTPMALIFKGANICVYFQLSKLLPIYINKLHRFYIFIHPYTGSGSR